MKFAQQITPGGGSRMVDSTGKPLGKADVDFPLLHVLPKMFVPAEALEARRNSRILASGPSGLSCDSIDLEIKTTLPYNIVPDGGIQIRQPYPNRRYFVGGSALIRNGWTVPLPLDTNEFDIEFIWSFSDVPWQLFHADEWLVRHLIHVKLKPGKGLTYSMDASCWPQKDGPAIRFTPVGRLGIEDEASLDMSGRDVVREGGLHYEDDPECNVGYFLEENIEIVGIPFEQAWSIDAFQEEHIHEVRQTAVLSHGNNDHRANGPVEMPAEVFVKAVNLANEIAFDKESGFAKSVAGIPGGFEQHPAMKMLCEWWNTARPDGEPLKPGSAMPLVRVRDDGEYWFAYYEVPNAPVEKFNPSGRDAARIGDLVLVVFHAEQVSALFDEDGMTIKTPSGEDYTTVGIARVDFDNGEYDEAWYCLQGLASFPSRFPAVWGQLNQLSG